MARKQKMKVYHGIPKSTVDKHTIFYADYNYIMNNICFENSYYLDRGSKDSAIGLATNKVINVKAGTFNFGNNKPLTIDIIVENLKSGSTEDMWGCLVGLGTDTPAESNHMTKLFSILNYSKNEVHQNAGLFGRAVIGKQLQTDDLLYIRFTFDGNKTVRGYVNGKLTGEGSIDPNEYNKWKGNKDYVLCINTGHNWQGKRNNCYVSEFHISNIDRGDYFPNLPQDFIDGKAVIKPKLSQQQIKGDPVYSQTTTVKIPAFKDETSKLYCMYDNRSKGYLKDNPEIFDVVNANVWDRGSTFKIRGLNGEVISGVIDGDTALCVITSDTISTQQWTVNDVSKLREGDSIVCTTPDFAHSSPVGTISEINTNTKTIKLSSPLAGFEALKGYYIFETSVTSSCPTVKTKTGTKVEGTWSGLGTKEAKFILSDNPTSLKGQDLYVEYSLNIPYGNSDFPEIPYSVERAWGENGVEMKPVNEIAIVDDFKGKVCESNIECPHVLKQGANSSLVDPQSNSLSEISTERYGQISVKDDITRDYSVGTNRGAIPQHLISFNIIEIIERKLGAEIPSENKLTWVYNNVTVAVDVYARGTCPSGNYVQLNVYKAGVGWVDSIYNSTSQIHKMSWGNVISDGRVDSTGNIHFLLSTKACDGSTTSTIYLDYVHITLGLKTDSTFTTLYCDNKRAREDKCNPVLVQKETKTVKRYLPSKECFTTECKYAKFKNDGVTGGLDVLATKNYSVEVSTSEYNQYMSGSRLNLNQLPLPTKAHLYLPIVTHNSIPNHVQANVLEIPSVHWWSNNGQNIFMASTTETSNFKTCISGDSAFKGQVGGYKDNNNNIVIYGDIDTTNLPSKDGLRLCSIALVDKKGELMLYVVKSSAGHRFYCYSDAVALFKIPNRPLIK